MYFILLHLFGNNSHWLLFRLRFQMKKHKDLTYYDKLLRFSIKPLAPNHLTSVPPAKE